MAGFLCTALRQGHLWPMVRVGCGEMWDDAGRLTRCHAKDVLDREAFRYKLVRNRTEFCESRKENRVETDRKILTGRWHCCWVSPWR